MKKTLALLLALVMVFSLAACGKKAPAFSGSSIAVCLASEPDTLDPALNSAVDGATMLVHLFSGLAKWEMVDGVMKIVPDAAEELVLELSKPAGSDGMDFYSEKSSVSYLYLRVRTKLFEAADTQAKEIPMSDADLDIYSLKKGVAGLLAFPKGKR